MGYDLDAAERTLAGDFRGLESHDRSAAITLDLERSRGKGLQLVRSRM